MVSHHSRWAVKWFHHSIWQGQSIDTSVECPRLPPFWRSGERCREHVVRGNVFWGARNAESAVFIYISSTNPGFQVHDKRSNDICFVSSQFLNDFHCTVRQCMDTLRYKVWEMDFSRLQNCKGVNTYRMLNLQVELIQFEHPQHDLRQEFVPNAKSLNPKDIHFGHRQ